MSAPTVDRLLDKLEQQVPPGALKTWQALRSRYGPLLVNFERRYLQSDPAQRVARVTGIDATYVSAAAGVVAVLAFWAAFKRAASLVVNLVGFAYPVYQSVKAIEDHNESETKQWLSYWTMYSTFTCVEHYSDVILHWVPMYYFAKLAALVYLYHPSSRGAEFVYMKTLHPLYQKYHVTIDDKLNQGRQHLASATKAAIETIEEVAQDVSNNDDS